jgi:hypothetical protein
LLKKLVSNPKVIKAELMVRMRGFEELSKEHDHQVYLLQLPARQNISGLFQVRTT